MTAVAPHGARHRVPDGSRRHRGDARDVARVRWWGALWRGSAIPAEAIPAEVIPAEAIRAETMPADAPPTTAGQVGPLPAASEPILPPVLPVPPHALGGEMARDVEAYIHPTTRWSRSAHIGSPYRRLQHDEEWERLHRPLTIGARCDIGPFCVVAEEVRIGDDTILDAYTLVEGGATIGDGVVVTHRASIGAKAVVEDGCVIAALVCERARVGSGSRVFGDLIHRQLDPTLPWDAEVAIESSPRLGSGVFVGWGATVVGGVNIGDGAYVCAGATVTKDVAAGMIVTGVNEQVRPEDWHGTLGKSHFFRGPDGMHDDDGTRPTA